MAWLAINKSQIRTANFNCFYDEYKHTLHRSSILHYDSLYSAALRSITNMAGIRAASDGRAKNARELDVPVGLRFSSKAWIISLCTSAIADHSQSWSWSVFDQLIEWSWTGDGDIDVPSATQNGNSTSRMDGISPLDTEKNSTSTLHQNWSENTTMRSDSISPPNTTATSILDLHQIRSDKLMPSSTDVHLCSTSSSHGLTATTGDCWPVSCQEAKLKSGKAYSARLGQPMNCIG